MIIAKKLLQQCLFESVGDKLVDCVIRTRVIKFIKKGRVSVMRKKGCCKREWRQRKSWEEFSAALTDRRFRRYFQMSRECFDMLCTKIKSNIGEGAFKGEQYLSELLSTLAPRNRGSGGKNVIFSNGPNSTSECSKLLY